MIDLSHLPPSSQNNHRSIAREAIARFEKNPCERWQHQVEVLTGLTGDHSDKDFGEKPNSWVE